MSRMLVASGLFLFALGLFAVGQSSWIAAKATLANVLIEDAWVKTLGGAGPARPWPFRGGNPSRGLA